MASNHVRQTRGHEYNRRTFLITRLDAEDALSRVVAGLDGSLRVQGTNPLLTDHSKGLLYTPRFSCAKIHGAVRRRIHARRRRLLGWFTVLRVWPTPPNPRRLELLAISGQVSRGHQWVFLLEAQKPSRLRLRGRGLLAEDDLFDFNLALPETVDSVGLSVG